MPPTMPPPLIDVITVVFNGERTIEHTIRSVLDQRYARLNYTVIDGGSSDRTVPIIQRYASRLAGFISEPDRGIYDAMNKGIAAATGDLVLFLNAGDTLRNMGVLADFVRDHYTERRQLLYLFSVLTDDGTLIEPVNIGFRRCYKLPVYHQGIIYPLAVLKGMPYNLKYRLVADYYNYYILSKTLESRPVPLVLSRFDTSGITSTDTRALNREFVEAYRALGIHSAFKLYRKLRVLFNR